MKIAILSSGAGHLNRGIEMWSINLTNILKSRRLDVMLFKGGGKKESKFEKVIPCIRMNTSFLGGTYSRLSWGLRHHIQQYSFVALAMPFLRNYDILQTADYRVGRVLKKAKQKGLIKGEIFFTDQSIFDLELLRGFKYVQVMSKHYLDEATELGIDTKKWTVIPNFVDTNFFKPSEDNLRSSLGIDRGAFVVLSVGAVEGKYKRMNWIIDEVSRLKNNIDKEVHLIICGEKEAEYKEVVSHGKSILEKNIHFLFNLPHNEMPKVYNTADVFVLGSTIERFGLAFIEAMACEVPAIGHIFPVTEWIIGDGGENVDMTKRGDLATSLEKYTDSTFKEKKGRVARRRVEAKFSPDVAAEKFLDMYGRIIKK